MKNRKITLLKNRKDTFQNYKFQTLRLNDENAGDEKEREKDIVEEIEKWSAEREDEKPEKTAYLRGIPKVVEQGPKSASTLVNLQVRIEKNAEKAYFTEN